MNAKETVTEDPSIGSESPEVKANLCLLNTGLTFYDCREYEEALRILIEARSRWKELGKEAPNDWRRETDYYLYRSYVMLGPRRVAKAGIEMPTSQFRLEWSIGNNPKYRRVVQIVDRWGRPGLILYTFFETYLRLN